MTEICDYMKLVWPHVARLHCRGCGKPVTTDSPQSIWKALIDSELGTRNSELLIAFDLPLSEKLSLSESLALIEKQGYQRLLLDGEIVRLDEAGSRVTHRGSRILTLTVIQDRLRIIHASRARFIEACEQAYHFGKGKLAVHLVEALKRSSVEAEKASTLPRFDTSTLNFSNRLHCARCDIEYREPTPALFSFNHPVGACPKCKGFGRIITIDYDLAIPDRSLTLAGGAVKPWRTGFSAECQSDLAKFCKIRRVPMNVAFAKLSREHQRWVIEGDKDYGMDESHEWPRAWYGVKGYFKWLETKSYKMHVRVLLSRYRAYTKCPDCDGQRFNKDAQLYRLSIYDLRSTIYDLKTASEKAKQSSIINHQSSIGLADFYALPIRDALALVEVMTNSRITHRASRTDPIFHALSEVRSRLAYLNDVGLGYLTLDRPTRSLSGGETERVNLTTCLGTRLVNTLFVLDEPSVGLHARDTERLVSILEKLRDAGNTVVVVEHEASVMRAADQIVDLGPGHGATGGQVVFQGAFRDILTSNDSLTGQYLSDRRQIEIPPWRPVEREKAESRRLKEGQRARYEKRTEAAAIRDSALGLPSEFELQSSDLKWLTVSNVTRHNLLDLAVEIPLNRFVCVTGVSGSGKSTLVREVLHPALVARLNGAMTTLKASERIDDEQQDEDDSSRVTNPASRITGYDALRRVVFVDQSILGKTPRSNPAVYIGAFDDIREVFAQSETAKRRGLNASAFSFNSAQGQCERCRGAGFEKIEMQFLSDVFVRCPDCNGRRYREHVLAVKISPQSTVRGSQARRSGSRFTHHALRITSWSIADLLEATVDEVVGFLGAFSESKPAQRAAASLRVLQQVGLGYLRLGQPINTLSGGESQRLKLVRHLADVTLSPVAADVRKLTSTSEEGQSLLTSAATLFLFDEPTTGLHFDDVRVLLKVFQRLVDAGHSVIVIEHNLDVIKCADWVIDLGPDAGDEGGQIVVEGTPDEIAACEQSHTGRALKPLLNKTTKQNHEKNHRYRVACSRSRHADLRIQGEGLR
jgi:excinuclease ABC subunit A